MASGELERLLQALLQPRMQTRPKAPSQLAVEYFTLTRGTESAEAVITGDAVWGTAVWGEFLW